MSKLVDFKRAVYNWEGDNLSLLYQYLQDTFPSLSEDDKKVLEEETAKTVLYVHDNKKYVTALLFLQNKEFRAPCVNKPAPAYIPTRDQQAKSAAVSASESVAVSERRTTNTSDHAISRTLPDLKPAYIPNPALQVDEELVGMAARAARRSTNTSDHAVLRTLREYNQRHRPDLPDDEVSKHVFDTLSTILKEGLP
jgi:hypothetical protein